MANGENAGLCTKCRERPRLTKQRWCRVCFNAWRAEHRQSSKVVNACNQVNAESKRGDEGEGSRQPAAPGSTDHVPESPQVGAPATPNGNGHWAGWNPRAKVATRVLLAALGRNGGEATKALMDGLADIAINGDRWQKLALWREFRNAVEGTPPKATPPPDARPRSRIVVQVGPEPAPPAEVAGPPATASEHFEDGERFVSVPPPD